MWVGGRSMRSLRRAIALGDGWVPFGLSHDEIAAMFSRVDKPERFEMVLATGAPLDPTADPAGSRAAVEQTRDAGATVATATIAARDAEHYCDQLAALASLARDAGVQIA